MFEFDLKFTELVESTFFFYDFITSAISLAEEIELFKKLKLRFKVFEGYFVLLKWRTINLELREKLSKHKGINNRS